MLIGVVPRSQNITQVGSLEDFVYLLDSGNMYAIQQNQDGTYSQPIYFEPSPELIPTLFVAFELVAIIGNNVVIWLLFCLLTL